MHSTFSDSFDRSPNFDVMPSDNQTEEHTVVRNRHIQQVVLLENDQSVNYQLEDLTVVAVKQPANQINKTVESGDKPAFKHKAKNWCLKTCKSFFISFYKTARSARIFSLLIFLTLELAVFYFLIEFFKQLQLEKAQAAPMTQMLIGHGINLLKSSLMVSAGLKFVFGTIRLIWLTISLLWQKEYSSWSGTFLRTLTFTAVSLIVFSYMA